MKFTTDTPQKISVFISGQKFFGEQVLRICINQGFKIAGVCCPTEDKYIARLARLHDIPIIPAGLLNYDTMPAGVDLGIAAHSFDYVGKKTRYKASLGWIGFHPSLLPRHRGRSAIEWAIRMKDPITGGTIYWLNSGIDRGDIAYQDWCFVDPKLFVQEPRKAASQLWQEQLLPIGLKLFEKALIDISGGTIMKAPQDPRFSTFEPCTDLKDIYRPDLLMLCQRN